MELVRVAGELGKLDELAGLVESQAIGDDANLRARLALLAMIAVAQGRDDAARDQLSQIYSLVKRASDDEPVHQRWPALAAAWAALERPALRSLAAEMLQLLVESVQRKFPAGKWERIVRHARDRARWLQAADAGPRTFGQNLESSQWQAVAHATAQSRGEGFPPMQWRRLVGGLKHDAGHDHDYVYFAVPLRGNFELSAEISTFGWREIETCYGALLFGVVADHKSGALATFERARPNVAIDPPLEHLGFWYRLRLRVEDGRYTAFVNDRQVFSERLPDEPDPWLAFHSRGSFGGEVRNVRITGSPQTPAELHLSAAAQLDAWLAEYYGETVSGAEPGWEKRGEEIFGRKVAAGEGIVRESLLSYHRPMLEDGEIEYVFYYAPGAAAVAPAVDRLALLLEPAGVEIHWLSDSQYDRGGLPPNNRTTEPGNRRGPAKLPLKERDWNAVRLALAKDAITLSLNGAEIYRRELEPTNQRTFGFYHDAAQTEARVRNVVYRGAWPKSLPPLDKQELAVSPAERAALEANKLKARFDFDFRGAKPIAAELAPVPENAEMFVSRAAAGARIALPPSQQKPDAVGFEPRFRLRGDFEIVAVYSELKTTTDPKAWGPGIDLHLHLDGADNPDLMLERRQREDGVQISQAIYAFDLPGKIDRRILNFAQPTPPAAGKLKIARKGPIAYFLFAERDSDDYQLIAEQRVGEEDVVRAQVYARAFSKESGVDVVLERLSIRAESTAK